MNKIKTGDTVQIMRGKDADKRGEVLALVQKKDKKGNETLKLVVKGVNIVKRSQKPNAQLGLKGGIVEIEKPIDISNVMFVDKKMDIPTRVGFKVDKKTGKKFRFSKKSGEQID